MGNARTPETTMIGDDAMGLPALVAEFEGLLAEEFEQMESLVETLRREREATIFLQLDEIGDVLRAKQAALLRLEALAAARQGVVRAMARQLQVPGGTALEGVLAALAPHAALDRIRHLLSCIRSMAQAAQELNDSQRQFIAYSLADIEASKKLVDSLQHMSGGCYDRGGQAGTARGAVHATVVSRTV